MKNIKFVAIALILISQALAQNGAWYQMTDAPNTLRRGCAITWGGNDTLYALRGSNSGKFYAYIISSNTWIQQPTIESIPARVDTGGAIARARSCSLYAISGKNSSSFYLYRTNLNQWLTRNSAPEGFHKGASLCWAGGDTIYATKGNNTNKFFKYSISQNTWRTWTTADTTPERAQEGTSMCWTGDNYIYTILGGSSNRFYRYHILNRTWERCSNANAYWTQGAGLVWDGGTKIYAVKGGGKDTLLVYNILTDMWITTIITPDGIGGKAEGAGLLAWDNRSNQKQLYLMRGASSNIFYRYCLPFVTAHSLVEGFEVQQFPPGGWQSKPEGNYTTLWKRSTSFPSNLPYPNTAVAEYDPVNSTSYRNARLITPKFYLGFRPTLVKIQFYMYNSAPDYPGNDTLLIEYYKIPENKFYQVVSFRRFDSLVSQGWVRREVSFVCVETDTILISFRGKSWDEYSIYIDSIAISIDTTKLCSTTPFATASNQSHLLTRKPEHQMLHTIFRTAILDTTGAPNGKALLYYSWSDNGTSWSKPYLIDTTQLTSDESGLPTSRGSISVGVFDGKQPWITYVKQGKIWTAIQRQNGIWKKMHLYTPSTGLIRGLSMAMGLTQGLPSTPDLAYVVANTEDYEGGPTRRIYFFAFDTTGARYAETLLAQGDIIKEPSIAVTPGDYIHVAYMGYDAGVFCIYYRTTLTTTNNYQIRQGTQINWSDTFRVSLCPGYPTEAALHPSVEAYGASVYVAWRGGGGAANAEIWRRKRDVGDPYNQWFAPQNMSQSPGVSSRHPVMSTNQVTAFQEDVASTNKEVYANLWGTDILNISQTDSFSHFPHINVEEPPPPPAPYELKVNTIWTERLSDKAYEIKFRRYSYIPRTELSYYTIETGDSIQSPMCQSRDGFIRYPQLPIDFSNQKAVYQLPYLHPNYHHKIKAVVYHRAQGRFRQNFTIDSIQLGSIEYNPGIAETIEIVIPKGSYQVDSRALLEITKNRGQFVTLAKPLIVYRYEVPETTSSGSGSQSSGQISILTKPVLYQNFPNPFRSHTTIRYQLPQESKVSIRIYNVSGRLVKTLVNQHQTSNIYSITWDGKDILGKTVSSGIYFYRLETDNYQTTNRAIIIK